MATGEQGRCEGSGRPVFLDYAGPGVAGAVPRCSVCRNVVNVEALLNAAEHDR